MQKPDFIDSFGVLELKKGDVIVLKTKGRLSEEAYEALMKSFMKELRAITGDNDIKVMVLDQESDIGIIRKGER